MTDDDDLKYYTIELIKTKIVGLLIALTREKNAVNKMLLDLELTDLTNKLKTLESEVN